MRRLKFILPVLAVILIGGGVGAYVFFKDDAPAKVNLDSAVKSAQDATTTTSGDGSTGTTADSTADGIDGTWTVDTTTGDFDFDSASGTFAGFRIKENLAGVGSTTAVGRTGDVAGTITIDGTKVTAAEFTVDVSTITTNDDRRNDKVQSALETTEFPGATFELTSPIDLGDSAASGDKVTVTATGDLTIHGVTKSVQMPIEAQLVNGKIVAVGSVDIVFSDYGVSVPQSAIVVSVEDHGTLELQMLLAQA